MKYGPNTPAVERLIEQAHTLTPAQAEQLDIAWEVGRGAGRIAAWEAAWDAIQGAGRIAAWEAAWDAITQCLHAARDARYPVWNATRALVVRDLISEEHFNTLYGSWASVFGEAK